MQYSRLPDALMEAALGLRTSVPIFGAAPRPVVVRCL